jgi:hypothetical protein
MGSLSKITPFLDTTSKCISVDKVMQDMDNFQRAMDDLAVSAGLIDGTMTKQTTDENSTVAV